MESSWVLGFFHVRDRAVSSICAKVERSIREETFVKEFKMSGLPSLIDKFGEFVTELVGFFHHASYFIRVYFSYFLYDLLSYKYHIIFPHWQQSEDGKRQSKIVNVLQDIVEIITQDVMVDGHLYVWNTEWNFGLWFFLRFKYNFVSLILQNYIRDFDISILK